MADRSGAAAAAEPAAAAAASQPSSQNQRRSSRLSTDDDAELVSLAEEELPAVAQRRALDAAPVEADDYLQVRSRVSCEARCFDTKGGTSPSIRPGSLRLTVAREALPRLSALRCAGQLTLLVQEDVAFFSGRKGALQADVDRLRELGSTVDWVGGLLLRDSLLGRVQQQQQPQQQPPVRFRVTCKRTTAVDGRYTGGAGSGQKTSTTTATTTTKRSLKRPRKSARKSCQKNDEPARHFCAANLNLRNGCPTRPIPAVSVLIPGAFCPLNHLIPPVTLNNETSLATHTPQHPQK